MGDQKGEFDFMKKKIAIFLFALFLTFLLASCTSKSLSHYKMAAIEIMETRKNNEKSYTPSSWQLRCQIVDEGKNEVSKAENKETVDNVLNTTLMRLNNVFYNTQIDIETRTEIERLYIKWFGHYYTLNGKEGLLRLLEISTWRMDCYYGLYNGFYVFHYRVWGFGVTNEEVINGLSFFTSGSMGINVVSEEFGGSLTEVYMAGYITSSDLNAIYEINRELDSKYDIYRELDSEIYNYIE